ncbi:peroxiredoxin family protein [Planctomycetota bacterium]|nr:peroxiredoxin family protein [Planctomycetota bacterium]
MAAIDFTLPDEQGGQFSFDADSRGKKNALLSFYRGYW